MNLLNRVFQEGFRNDREAVMISTMIAGELHETPLGQDMHIVFLAPGWRSYTF